MNMTILMMIAVVIGVGFYYHFPTRQNNATNPIRRAADDDGDPSLILSISISRMTYYLRMTCDEYH